MINVQGIYGKAGLFLLISAGLHLVYFLVTGFGEFPMLIFATLYAVFAIGVMRPMRWLAYIVFVVMLFGIIVSYALNDGGLAGFVSWGITIAELGAAICLFIYLWRNKSQAHSIAG